MRRWSPKSKKVHDQLDVDLQILVTRIRDEVGDITLISGHRDEMEQETLYREAKTTLHWPQSKHNTYPAVAVDIQPYPMPTDEKKLWGALGYLAGRAFGIAKEMNIKIRWGGDWDRDGDLTNQKFDDLFHLELIE